MNILIAADIFGHTPALDRLAGRLEADTIKIVSPYDGKTCFADEAKAYAFFSDRVGIPAYAQKIADHLKSGHPRTAMRPHTLIGFSVGASAIWHLSDTLALTGIGQAVGFYGAQIRHHTTCQPVFDIQLIWPRSEPAFDVDLLISDLKKKPKVSCCKTAGLHGFMNERSKNFDGALYAAWLKKLNRENRNPRQRDPKIK
jgi:dienelactone hydrolase